MKNSKTGLKPLKYYLELTLSYEINLKAKITETHLKNQNYFPSNTGG